MPSLNFLKSSPQTEALRIESEPPDADARTTNGQSCRTPCELAVQAGTEFSVTLALSGYQPQTVSVRPEAPPAAQRDPDGFGGAAKLSPNPVHVELQPAVVPPPKNPVVKKKKPIASASPAGTTADNHRFGSRGSSVASVGVGGLRHQISLAVALDSVGMASPLSGVRS
jgi:hypothetical protein